jgi:peptide/nickel transport system permease protein
MSSELPGDTLLPSAGMGAQVKELLRRSWLFRIGLFLVAVAVLLAIFGPYLARFPLEAATPNANLPPSTTYWFGTDPNGFDVFSRVLAAPRIDVAIALVATVIAFFVGSAIGLSTGYFRGWPGELVMRVADLIQSFPLYVLAIIIVVLTGRSFQNIVLVIALLNIPIYVRLVRSQVLSLRERTFVEAGKAAGTTELNVAFRHVLPNGLSPALAQVPITIGFAILITAGLSFIGAGVQPPTPEWGAMVASGAEGIIIGEWWTSFFPGVAISLTVFGFAVAGEALRAVFLREV